MLNLPVQGMRPGAAIGILTCWLHLEILIFGSHRDAPDLSRFKVSRPLEEDRLFSAVWSRAKQAYRPETRRKQLERWVADFFWSFCTKEGRMTRLAGTERFQ